MQNHDWIELFRLIPENQQNVLVLTTISGVELSVETIIRTELEYLVFRGRVCGSTDDGRLFFLPYRQIDYLQVNRSMKEAEIRELFGETDGPRSGFASSPGSAMSSSMLVAPKSGVSGPPRMTAAAPARAANAPAGIPNIPAAALVPPPAAPGNAAGPQRNSILERLRAQRNAVLPPRPPAR